MKKVIIKMIVFYQHHISLFLENRGVKCKFYPSCSQYAIEAFEKYGIWKGFWLSTKRIIRCNPFSKGGYDPLK